MRPGSQNDRLLRWLRANPGASGMEIITALRLPKYTGRISELRQAGYVIACEHDDAGIARYRVVEQPVQLAVGL